MNVRAIVSAQPASSEVDADARVEPSATPLSATEAALLARTLSALADPVRLQLVSIVAAKGAVCSCDLETPLAKSQPTISHHTKILARAGILIGEKRGRWTWWRVAPNAMNDLYRTLNARSLGDAAVATSEACE